MDEDAVLQILALLRNQSIEAIAVCLIWSIVNPLHELRIGELIAQHLPGVPFTLSHQLNPVLREYRRTSSTAIDASLKPLMGRYLRELDGRLKESGFGGRLLVISTAGGLMDPQDVADMPILSINSGPAVAPIAARHYVLGDLDHQTAVVADTGGTSYDVALVRRGEIPMTRETWLGPKYVGHITGFPAVDVRSVGAGGGSIAWVDHGGMLHVGPASAGAVPGPAAYGRGGTSPTVTDAALVLGYVDPEYFLNGEMALDVSAAQAAIEDSVATPLGVELLEAADAILTLATEHMVQAIHTVTVEQGVDPREAILVGGGGAAGLNAVPVARRLGCTYVVIPDVGAALSAAGALVLDLTAEFSAPLFVDTGDFDHAAANRVMAGLRAQCHEFAARMDVALSEVRIEYTAEARYAHQVWEIDLPLGDNGLSNDSDVADLIDTFHARHQEIFAMHDVASDIHILGLRARVICKDRGEQVLQSVAPSRSHPTVSSGREMYFAGHGLLHGQVWIMDDLEPAKGEIRGPGVIESQFTTVVLDPGTSAQRLENGNLLVIP
jgi:N-methylhydantoinase A